MFWRSRRVFAGRGIALPGFGVTVLVVACAFGLGVATGWATGFVPGLVGADPAPSPSPSPQSSITSTVTPVLPPMAPITRALNPADRKAGVTTTDITLRAAGTVSVVPGIGKEVAGDGDIRWVAIAIEDGVTADAAAFKSYVLETLNANKGWGTEHSLQFVATDGVADFRIVLASPYSTALLCPDPHVVKQAGPITEASSSPSPSPSASASPDASPAPAADSPWSCDQPGVVVISSYDWTAGLPAFGTDYAGSRTYLLNHQVGHLLGMDDTECVPPRADVMVIQSVALPEGCKVNPWPYPDATIQAGDPSADPSPSPTPSAGAK